MRTSRRVQAGVVGGLPREKVHLKSNISQGHPGVSVVVSRGVNEPTNDISEAIIVENCEDSRIDTRWTGTTSLDSNSRR